MAVEGGAGDLRGFGDRLDGDGFDAAAAQKGPGSIQQAVPRPNSAGVDVVVILVWDQAPADYSHSFIHLTACQFLSMVPRSQQLWYQQ